MLMGHGRVRKVNGTKTKMSKVCRGGILVVVLFHTLAFGLTALVSLRRSAATPFSSIL